MYWDIPNELRELIEPVVEDSNLELVDVTLSSGRPPWTLRVVIDTPSGDGQVDVDRCARVSRELATNLDAADAIKAAYRLEVSSPGLDRVLGREKDFAAACGEEVKIETRRPLEGRRRFRGRLIEFGGSVARVEVDGQPVAIPFDEVARANTVYAWSKADFARRGSSR